MTCLRATCLCGAHAAYRDTTGTNTGLLSSLMVTGQSEYEGWGGITCHVLFVQQGQRCGRLAGLGPNKWLRHHRQAVGCLLTFLCRPCSLATPMSPCPSADEGDCDPRLRVYGLRFTVATDKPRARIVKPCSFRAHAADSQSSATHRKRDISRQPEASRPLSRT